MGWGDEIMITGEVSRRGRGNALRFAIGDRRPGRQQHRWHEIWEGHPRIAKPGEAFDAWIWNHGGNRPYIEAKSIKRWHWRPYGPTPGTIILTEAEQRLREYSQGRVIVEPGMKAAASPNKDWGWHRWAELVNRYPQFNWLQIGAPGDARLPGVEFLQTAGFREACGALSGARAVVLREGGLHHAAAALGVPAVVIFGGYIAPSVTGYPQHRNLFTGGDEHPLGCGMRVPCPHCEAAMSAITPEVVKRELEVILAA